jgi:acyl-coenzyme A synthetase/AMP-(fatty) acid ligase
VLDESGRPVRPGETGEIVARGANVSPGYLDDPEETSRRFPDGALRTGDLATVDDEGFIYIVGRSADFIKSWGHRVSAQQVEEAALRHASVAEAAVIGLPDPEAGEAVTLAVVAAVNATIDLTELAGFLRSHLAKHMVPQTIHVIDELPLTASGKVSTAELQVRLAGGSAQVR